MKHDFLIVGCGFAGVIFAEYIASQYGLKSFIIDKRSHIGGNCYDKYENGNLIHEYGPHYFRTNSNEIFSHLSKFTTWKNAKYKILSWTDGQYWNFPINLNTFEQFIGKKSSPEEMIEILEKWRVPIDYPKNSEEAIVSQIGYELYNKFYKNYTIKQWKKDPKDLDISVCGRIPIRTNRDDLYFNDKIQALPEFGYTELFKNILDNKLIKIELNTSLEQIDKRNFKRILYTGPIDEYYKFEYGELPYRSLIFKKETHNIEYYQPAVQINYPNNYSYTRIIETKHITGIKTSNTTIVKEYPAEFKDTGERFYPVPTIESKDKYDKYYQLTKKDKKIIFIGRLATYQYLNMDQVIGMALKEAKKCMI